MMINNEIVDWWNALKASWNNDFLPVFKAGMKIFLIALAVVIVVILVLIIIRIVRFSKKGSKSADKDPEKK